MTFPVSGHAARRRSSRFRRRRAFTLVEVVMVVTIIGMISSMAIPRLSQGAADGASDAALAGDLAIIRKAINFYSAEHRGDFPGLSSARFVQHMTTFTDMQGNTSPTRGPSFQFGPYLVKIPPCPVGENAGNSGVLIDAANSPPKSNPNSGRGWVYNPNTGEFYANTGTRFQAGVKLTDTVAAIDVGLN